MDRIASISIFVKIVEAGGFVAVARKLGVSPSTVTTQIQDPEDRLGMRLLNRSMRKVSLSEIGKNYYEHCMRILNDIAEARSAIHAVHSQPSSTFSLSIPSFIGPVIAKFTSPVEGLKFSLARVQCMDRFATPTE
jgi:DNA-binding transcriptional LysR family regulator